VWGCPLSVQPIPFTARSSRKRVVATSPGWRDVRLVAAARQRMGGWHVETSNVGDGTRVAPLWVCPGPAQAAATADESSGPGTGVAPRAAAPARGHSPGCAGPDRRQVRVRGAHRAVAVGAESPDRRRCAERRTVGERRLHDSTRRTHPGAAIEARRHHRGRRQADGVAAGAPDRCGHGQHHGLVRLHDCTGRLGPVHLHRDCGQHRAHSRVRRSQ
jgi:hypothetical protein